MKTTPAALKAAAMGDIKNFLAASTPGGIEAQEARGQRNFVASETLPMQGTSGKSRAAWEKLGFKFGEEVDDIFVKVEFPAGWKKQATGHSMWSDLLDDKGRKRAGIFYKAAFYDRSAHVGLTPRFSYGTDYAHPKPLPVTVTDDGKAIHCLGTFPDGDWHAQEELRQKAQAWLDEKYPEWADATAYWD